MKRLYQATFEQVRLSPAAAAEVRSRLQTASAQKEVAPVKKRVTKTILIVAAVIAALTCAAFAAGGQRGLDGAVQAPCLVVPDVATVRAKGYPVNERGETYGPHVPEMDDPDLVLAENRDGLQGYIRPADEPLSDPKTREEARRYMELPPYTFKLYLQDGETVIGTFDNG